MNQAVKTAGTKRLLPAMAMATLWLAGAAGGWAADTPAATNRPAAAAGDVAVLVDETMPWQHLHLEGPSHFSLADATNTPATFASQWQLGAEPPSISTATGALVKVGITFVEGKARPMLWRSEWTSPLPPADWALPAFDDSAWARLYWPQPQWEEINAQENGSKVRAPNPYDTVVLLARHRLVITDPAQVKVCRLSLEFWGGVVVYVNGKEAARSHLITLPGGKTNLFDNVAEAYPESEWQRSGGKDPGSAPLGRRAVESERPQQTGDGVRSGHRPAQHNEATAAGHAGELRVLETGLRRGSRAAQSPRLAG